MRTIKIVADSSADLMKLEHTAFASAPLKIITDDNEFIDDQALDTGAMVAWFDSYKGKSKTSCPNTSDWLKAFSGADDIFCVTITSGLSGSYNAACAAKELLESEHPEKRVCVIDSLSAGPELVLIIEKLEDMIREGLSYEEICRQIREYQVHTGLTFMLSSLKNFAANGRVSPAVAKIAGILGIRIVGKASDQGTLKPTNKCRGEARSLEAIVDHLYTSGLRQGKVRIAHCMNRSAAQTLQDMIHAKFPNTDIKIHACRGLCSYYAEKGGLLVGFEKI